MSHATATGNRTFVVEARPERNEIVVAVLEPGHVLRVHHPDGRTVDHTALHPGGPLFMTVVGDKTAIMFGAEACKFAEIDGITKHRHVADRHVWAAAALGARQHGVAYLVRGEVTHKRRTFEGAVSVRFPL